MRYLKKSNSYAASNVTFNLDTYEARSYNWWIMFKKIGAFHVFNNYSYSVSTTKHQYKLRQLLDNLGIHISLNIAAPKGLQDLDSAIEHYKSEIANLKAAIARKGSKTLKNKESLVTIRELGFKIRQVKGLQHINARYSNT